MSKISKPDANPILAAVLTVFFALGHILINGQTKKWVVNLLLISGLSIAISVLVGVTSHFVPALGSALGLLYFAPLLLAIFSIVDAHHTAEKLKAGREVEENEYSLGLLFKVVKLVDKTAIFVA